MLYQEFLTKIFDNSYVNICERPFRNYFKLDHNLHTNWIILPFKFDNKNNTLTTYWIDPILLSDTINLTFKLFQTKYSFSKNEGLKRIKLLKFLALITNYLVRVDYHFPKLPVSFWNPTNKKESFKELLSKLFDQKYELFFSESFKKQHPTIHIRLVNYMYQLLDNPNFIKQTDYFAEISEYIQNKIKRSRKKDANLDKYLSAFNINFTVSKGVAVITKSTSKNSQNSLKIPVKDPMLHPILEEVYELNLHSIIKRINYLIQID